MESRMIERQFKDPTAAEAIREINRQRAAVTRTESQPEPAMGIEPQEMSLIEIMQRQYQDQTPTREKLLHELNIRFPDERTKGSKYRNPEYSRLRNEIMRGNFEVFNVDANKS